jgi:hypothetical protein
MTENFIILYFYLDKYCDMVFLSLLRLGYDFLFCFSIIMLSCALRVGPCLAFHSRVDLKLHEVDNLFIFLSV